MSRLTTEIMRPSDDRMVGEIFGAEQAHLLGGHRGEQDRPARPVAGPGHRPGHLDQSGDAGGIVHRAVADPVAFAASPGADRAMPIWSRCAISSTYSSASAGSVPGSTATTLGLVKRVAAALPARRAPRVGRSAKPRGLRAGRAASSATA